jgi:hypothetical protein
MTAEEIKRLTLIEQALDTVSHEIELIRELQKRMKQLLDQALRKYKMSWKIRVLIVVVPLMVAHKLPID